MWAYVISLLIFDPFSINYPPKDLNTGKKERVTKTNIKILAAFNKYSSYVIHKEVKRKGKVSPFFEIIT